ncbi:MAG: peptidoglycan DD-metalloendopeptidase family protein [Bacteroidota bacterium]
MRIGILFPYLCLVCLLCPILSWAQGEPPRDELEKEILLTEDLLAETSTKEKKTLSSLKLLNRQISLRSQLIKQTELDIKAEEIRILELKAITLQMEKDIQRLSIEYCQMIQSTQNMSDNFWLMVLSSKNLSQAYNRVVYHNRLREYREKQIQAIAATKAYLKDKSEQLKVSIEKNKVLIDKSVVEKEKLSQSQLTKKDLYTNLKKEKVSIQQQLSQRKRKLKTFIRKEQETYVLQPTNVDEEYARNFKKRKGLLPWPIPPSNVVITEHFGESEDEFGNRIFNDGIYMRVGQGQPVKAVYSGKVTAVTRIPMSGTVVILEHGKFRTVYANIVNTYVKKGDIVSENQVLGSVRQDPRTGESLFNFLVYEIPDKFLDPEKWLLR